MILTSESLSCHSLVQILQNVTSKNAPKFQFFLILTSEWLSRHSLVQILDTISKSGPKLSVFHDFDFRKALLPQRGEEFGDIFSSPLFANPAFQS